MKYKTLIILVFAILLGENGISQNRQNLFDEITVFVEKERRANNIPNTVVGITNADSIIYLKNFGNGEIDDLYLIGSNSKSFTALAILILQEKGLIDINEHVTKYLPWFRYDNSEDSDKVTVKDLLNHTSGIPRKLGMYEPSNYSEIQLYYSDLLKHISSENNIVGEYEYSNLNYQLLGLIIEKVSNKKYSELLEYKILEPLNLNKTFATQNETERFGLIPSYQYLLYYPILPKRIKYNDYVVSSGFISSTASDMCHYLQALMNGNDSTRNSIISKNITDQLFESRADIGSKYGMGWEMREWKEFKRFKHDGLTQSFSSSMLILPELELGIVVMSNINNSPSTMKLRSYILENVIKV